MSEIYINYKGTINVNENKRFTEVIKAVKPGDHVVVRLDQNNLNQADHVMSFLQEQGLECLPKGPHDGHGYEVLGYVKNKNIFS